MCNGYTIISISKLMHYTIFIVVCKENYLIELQYTKFRNYPKLCDLSDRIMSIETTAHESVT